MKYQQIMLFVYSTEAKNLYDLFTQRNIKIGMTWVETSEVEDLVL